MVSSKIVACNTHNKDLLRLLNIERKNFTLMTRGLLMNTSEGMIPEQPHYKDQKMFIYTVRGSGQHVKNQ
jgi:hypothetical protein